MAIYCRDHISESAKEDIRDLMGWTEEEWNAKTVKKDPDAVEKLYGSVKGCSKTETKYSKSECDRHGTKKERTQNADG